MPINQFDIVILYFLQSMPHSQSQTVVVDNPMSVDESGKLVKHVDTSLKLLDTTLKLVDTSLKLLKKI